MTNDPSQPIPHLPDPGWVERVLSTGFKLCVQRLVTLHIGDGAAFMFTVPIQDVRQVTVAPRFSDDVPAYPRSDFPWNVDVVYSGAHFSFVCGSNDLASVRYIFAEVPVVDGAPQIGMPPAF
jgi:hypothetical protein